MKYDFDLDLETKNSLSCIIKRINKKSKILEFGCANGRLTKYLKEEMKCIIDIIEIDAEAGDEASKYANKALLGTIEGNAESLKWHDILKGEEYDFIIFADILEHLHNPKEVLMTAKSHLKDDGSILVSIPNIANNNVIANLLRNDFVYTDIGLLDNTHVTFFTKNSFEKIVKEIDCYLAYETATYINMGNCEVPIKFEDISVEAKKVLMKHELGDAYQFIFEIKNSPQETLVEFEQNPEKYIASSLYYRFENENIEKENVLFFNSSISNNTYTTHFEFEKPVSMIRFDPIESSCMINIKKVLLNNQLFPLMNLSDNAILKKDSFYIFEEDPQVFISVDNLKSFDIEIEYDIIDFDLEKDSIEGIKEMREEFGTQLHETMEHFCREMQVMQENQEQENHKHFVDMQLLEANNEHINHKYLNDEKRLDTLYRRLKWIWPIVDHKSILFQNGMIDFHIDSVVMSLRKLHIRGWCVSTDEENYKIKGRKTLSVHRYVRDDVNRVKGMEASYFSGFEIFACPFLPLKLCFKNGKNRNVYRVNATKLYVKYLKQVIGKIKKSIHDRGIKNTCKVALSKIRKRGNPFTDSYENWFFNHRITKKEAEQQKEHVFAYSPKITIVCPTYNTPENLLNEMIDSIKNQTYSNWELCIADGASANKATQSLLDKLAASDDRIKVKFLKENYMISGNTNEAIKMVTGEFVALMDHDDLLEQDALFEFVKLLNENRELDFIYTDEDKINEDGTHYMVPHFKPDFSLDTLRNYNYITHFALIRKTILDEIGHFDSKCDGAQDFDLFLRIADHTDKIGHVSKIMYHWRVCENSTAQSISTKSYVVEAGKYALRKHLERNNLKGSVTDGLQPTLYKVNYDILNNPMISIVICTKDHIDDLDTCIQSILKKSTYQNYEIVIVENNSEERKTFAYYEGLRNHDKIKVVYWEHDFNYSAINNFGVNNASGEYVLLLNNDTEVITPNWLEEMLMFAQRDDVGVVGAKLLYPDETVQHAGVIVGLGGVAAHSHRGYPADSVGYVGRMIVVQNISAVTGACMMIKKSKYLEVGGLSEEYRVTYNDVDFCLRVMKAGYHNIMNPFAQMYHYESKSRGMEDTPEKHKRFMQEQDMFKKDWNEILEKGDPYYNKNLTLSREDFSLKE